MALAARSTPLLATLVVCVLSGTAVTGYYLPGTAPHNYHEHDVIPVQANVLTSVNTHLPYDFYRLPICRPSQKVKGQAENLGEILMGDRIKPSPYETIRVSEDVECRPVCAAQNVDDKSAKSLDDLIKDDYLVNLIMDNLPLAVVNGDTGTYSVGSPLGVESPTAGRPSTVNNHIHFRIKYYELTEQEVQRHKEAEEKKKGKGKGPTTTSTTSGEADLEDDSQAGIKRIISFVAEPSSIAHDPANVDATCKEQTAIDMKTAKPQLAVPGKIVWSYGVSWEKTSETWVTRWDVYLNVGDHDVHWFSIINSTLTVLLLTTIVAFILLRTLRKEINKYNRLDLDPEDFQEETGWKLIHKDVFRPPGHAATLAALAGTGCQLLGMMFTVIVVACLGFLSPANRGALFTAMLVCFVFLGMYAGYMSARLLKLWGVPSWSNILVTATLVPGIAFGTFFIVNLFVWSRGSSGAVPLGTLVAVMAMWFCVSLPLVFVGAVFGYKKEVITLPVATSQIPRHVPQATWHMHPYFTVAVAGILPFGAVFIEVFFILTAVWLNRYYYVFGFLALVFIILVLTCAELTIVMVYFQLSAEDYRWWWRSFLTSGSCGGYLFAYSVFYFFASPLRMKSFVPIFIYFSYMGMLSFIFFVMTGTVGFLATFLFVRYIYGSIKVE